MRESELDGALTDRAAVVAGPHGEHTGHVIAYSIKPMVCIQHQWDGTKSWHVAEHVRRDPGGLTYDEVERARQLANVAGGPSEAAVLDLVAAVKRDALRAVEEQA